MSRWIQRNPWEQMRQHTAARIALGRVGASLPTREVLAFGLAHAQARDAVHTPLDVDALGERLAHNGFTMLSLQSQCADRAAYLMRPDLGRRLNESSLALLQAQPKVESVAIVIGDGLSSVAVERQALPLLEALRDHLHLDWKQLPIVVATQARVALGDEIGAILGAELVLMLIGERPGLSSPDSLGAYITYHPKIGRNDGERNCISNIRPEGLAPAVAAQTIAYLVNESLRLKLSGVGLKDDSQGLLAAD